jgi:uncharacterized membrane protein YecN with MAPEG domain
MPIVLPVTLLYGGLTVLLVVVLGAAVSLRRGAERIGPGQVPDKDLTWRIRAHGNAAEWSPLGIILLGLIEAAGGTSNALHAAGGLFFLGRVLHAVGMYRRSRLHTVGAAINYLVLIALAGWAIALRFTRWGAFR